MDLHINTNEPMGKPVMGDVGGFYERLLSPARDSLAPARSALRAFAAAANS